MNEQTFEGKTCFTYSTGSSDTLLLQPIAEHSLEVIDSEVELIKQLSGGKAFTMVMLMTDWNQDLPPWGADSMRGEAPFGAGAPETLAFILEHLIPEVSGISAGSTGSAGSADRAGTDQKIYLGGYSLAGLFALWAGYQTELFAGVAAASPSVWYPGWPAFAEENEVWAQKVYLSLGKKEEKTRHPVMKTVGANIRRQFELLSASPECQAVTLEMNPGNHFQDADLRMAKGFAWLMSEES